MNIKLTQYSFLENFQFPWKLSCWTGWRVVAKFQNSDRPIRCHHIFVIWRVKCTDHYATRSFVFRGQSTWSRDRSRFFARVRHLTIFESTWNHYFFNIFYVIVRPRVVYQRVLMTKKKFAGRDLEGCTLCLLMFSSQ